MMLSLIVAMDERGLIGRAGGLPWHLPADLRHFKQTTLGKPVVMGRRTWESIGRPLPERRNLVVSRSPGFAAEGAETVPSLDEALARCAGEPEAVVIGGAGLYAAALPHARRLYLTRVHGCFEGDVYFPHWNPGEWRERERVERPADERNPYALTFSLLERIRPD